MQGRYGPYVTDGVTNASLPRGTTPEEVTFEYALNLLKERAAAGPSKRAMRRRPARKPTAKAATPAKKPAKKTVRKAEGRKAKARVGQARRSSHRLNFTSSEMKQTIGGTALACPTLPRTARATKRLNKTLKWTGIVLSVLVAILLGRQHVVRLDHRCTA